MCCFCVSFAFFAKISFFFLFFLSFRCEPPFWVGFGPVEGDSLKAESFKMVEDLLEKGEFGWVLRE